MVLRFIIFLLMALVAGCASLKNPELAARLDAIPSAQREGVHVWLVNSPIDPLCLGGLPGLSGALREAGFPNVHFHLIPDAQGLASEIRHCLANRAGSRIALVGWSGGSLAVWDATTSLARDDVTIDLIAYLDSNWIVDRVNERDQPANFQRLLLIYRHNNTPPVIDRAEVVRAATGNHMAIPNRRETIEALIAALADLASQGEPVHSSQSADRDAAADR
jgi:hypothetical protein